MTMPFRAYLLTDSGSPRGSFVTRSLDDLDAGDVVVRVAYSDINYKDALAATGTGKILRRPSCVGGIDFSGTVTASTDPRFTVTLKPPFSGKPMMNRSSSSRTDFESPIVTAGYIVDVTALALDLHL